MRVKCPGTRSLRVKSSALPKMFGMLQVHERLRATGQLISIDITRYMSIDIYHINFHLKMFTSLIFRYIDWFSDNFGYFHINVHKKKICTLTRNRRNRRNNFGSNPDQSFQIRQQFKGVDVTVHPTTEANGRLKVLLAKKRLLMFLQMDPFWIWCENMFWDICLYMFIRYIYIYVFNISLGPFEHLEIGTNLAKLSKHAERPQFVATVLPIRHCQRHNWPTVCASRSGAHLNTSQHPKHPQNWSVLLLQLKRRRKPETRSATNINSSKNNSANQHLSQPF